MESLGFKEWLVVGVSSAGGIPNPNMRETEGSTLLPINKGETTLGVSENLYIGIQIKFTVNSLISSSIFTSGAWFSW